MRGLLISLFLSFLLSYALRYFLWSRTRRLHQKNRGPGPVTDRFVECPACGTYNPMKSAYEAGGKFFCHKECACKFSSTAPM